MQRSSIGPGRLWETSRAITFLVGFIWVALIQAISFMNADHAYFPVHDFLDHVVTLWWVGARFALPFDYGAPLPLLFGGGVVPAGALGLSDFSVIRLFYGLLPLEQSIVFMEAAGRLFGYSAVFFLFNALFQSLQDRAYGALVAGVSLALMPVWPSVTWTVGALAVAAYALVIMDRPGRRLQSYVLLIVSPHLAFFAWGGFLIPVMAVIYLCFRLLNGRARASHAVGALIAILSSGFSAAGLIYLSVFSDFISHRSAWLRLAPADWFGRDALADAFWDFPSVFFAGQYHFGTFFNWNPTPFWSATNTFALVAAIFVFPLFTQLWTRAKKPVNVANKTNGVPLVRAMGKLLGIQVLISLVFVLEVSGVMSAGALLGLPFQFNRVVALSPLIWALVAGISFLLVCDALPKVRRLAISWGAVLLITAQAFVINPSVGGPLRELLPNLEAGAPLGKYFSEDDYGAILARIQVGEVVPTAISVGLDPMLAVQAGIPSVDGYAYNYPLSHRESFRGLIDRSPSSTVQFLQEFDAWGSRLYVPTDGDFGLDEVVDWCAATRLGVELVLSDRRENPPEALQYWFTEGPINVFRVNPECQHDLD